MMVSTDYRTKLQSLTRRSKTKAKVIKPPFVFGKELLTQDSSTRNSYRCSRCPSSARSSLRTTSWLRDLRLPYTVDIMEFLKKCGQCCCYSQGTCNCACFVDCWWATEAQGLAGLYCCACCWTVCSPLCL